MEKTNYIYRYLLRLLKKIPFEEKYLLILVGSMFLVSILFSYGNFSFYQYALIAFAGFQIYFSWFFLALLMLPFALFVSVMVIIYKINFTSGYAASGKDFKKYLKKFARDTCLALLIITIFIFFAIVSGIILEPAHSRTVNQQIYDFEKGIFHVLPSIWLHTSSNPFQKILEYLSPLTLVIFRSFVTVTAVTVGLFLVTKNYRLVIKMATAFTLGMLMALAIWYVLPINSPNNFYIQEKLVEENYRPNKTTDDFQKAVYLAQKANKPITTIPSMHVLWSAIIVFYLGYYRKWLLFIAIPWFLFLYLGTFYFAQHYLIDGLLSLPLAGLAILLSGIFVKKALHWSKSAKKDLPS